MLYYLPVTATSEQRMAYAGAKELMRNTSEVGRIIELESAEELDELEEKLKSESQTVVAQYHFFNAWPSF